MRTGEKVRFADLNLISGTFVWDFRNVLYTEQQNVTVLDYERHPLSSNVVSADVTRPKCHFPSFR